MNSLAGGDFGGSSEAPWLCDKCSASFSDLFTSSGPELRTGTRYSLEIFIHTVTCCSYIEKLPSQNSKPWQDSN